MPKMKYGEWWCNKCHVTHPQGHTYCGTCSRSKDDVVKETKDFKDLKDLKNKKKKDAKASDKAAAKIDKDTAKAAASDQAPNKNS